MIYVSEILCCRIGQMFYFYFKVVQMKRVVPLILLFFFSFLVFRPAIPLVEYCLQKDYIAKVLCINKEKPQLKCNGKCHLSKQLQAETEETADSPFSAGSEKEQKQISEFIVAGFSLNTGFSDSHVPLSIFHNLYTYSFSLFVFHPPG